MKSTLKFGFVFVFACLSGPAALNGAERMPFAEQNALVGKYCAVCHTDAAKNGGLSLQHFDAGTVDPSLAAMLVSKLRGGAFGASGLPMPEQATRQGLMASLVMASAGSNDWTVSGGAHEVTASVLREIAAARKDGVPGLYRLVATCNTETKKGRMQLSWSPEPRSGTILASVDGKPLAFFVEGEEAMGNGTGGRAGPAAVFLDGVTLPVRSLRVSGLFPKESVEFPFDTLPSEARSQLAVCF